jgi:hypothetical protein
VAGEATFDFQVDQSVYDEYAGDVQDYGYAWIVAASQWSSAFDEAAVSRGFAYDPNGNGDIHIYVTRDELLGGNVASNATGYNGTGYIYVAASVFASRNPTYIANVAFHEMGHSLGFIDVDGGCGSNSGMASPTSTTEDRASPGPCDVRAVLDKYGADASPILINVTGEGVSLEDPVVGPYFDIYANGNPVQLSWPKRNVGFLVLDRNGNGAIDDGKELFGNATPTLAGGPAANGYLALRDFDLDGNDLVDAKDTVFSKLRIWLDANQDGRSTPSELRGLSDLGIVSIALDYRESRKRDEWGNEFQYRASVELTRGRTISYDVFLVTISTACASATDGRK